jgi:hypothetical protein
MADKPKRGSKRPSREPSALEAAARQVGYELRMLFHSAAKLGGWHASPISPVEDDDKNIALECFLLHFRNLRAFLCPSIQASSDDDIIASNFLDELDARDIGEAAVLSKDKKRLDRMFGAFELQPKSVYRGPELWLAYSGHGARADRSVGSVFRKTSARKAGLVSAGG